MYDRALKQFQEDINYGQLEEMTYNERFAFLLGFETALKTVETIALKECDKPVKKPLKQCGLMSATQEGELMKKSELKTILDYVILNEHVSGENVRKVFDLIGLSGPWETEEIKLYFAGLREGMKIESEEYPYCFEEEEE